MSLYKIVAYLPTAGDNGTTHAKQVSQVSDERGTLLPFPHYILTVTQPSSTTGRSCVSPKVRRCSPAWRRSLRWARGPRAALPPRRTPGACPRPAPEFPTAARSRAPRAEPPPALLRASCAHTAREPSQCSPGNAPQRDAAPRPSAMQQTRPGAQISGQTWCPASSAPLARWEPQRKLARGQERWPVGLVPPLT